MNPQSKKARGMSLVTWSSWLMLVLLLGLITFPEAIAFSDKYINNLCKESSDVAFCLEILNTDPRISAAHHLSDILLIAITQLKMQVDDATVHMDRVRGEFSGPNGRRRIEVCKRNYGIASDRFHTAWELVLQKSFWDVNKLASIGTNAVIDCENGWRMGGPIQKSPLTLYNMNVFKISEIILVIMQRLVT